MFVDDQPDVQSCVDMLDRYVTELRSYMKRFPWASSSAAPLPQEEAESDEWLQLSTEVTFRHILFSLGEKKQLFKIYIIQ